MYRKNCGAQVDGGARFYTSCSYNPSPGASFRSEHGPSVDPYGRVVYVNVKKEKKRAMKVALTVAFLVTIVPGAVIGFVALILLVMY